MSWRCMSRKQQVATYEVAKRLIYKSFSRHEIIFLRRDLAHIQQEYCWI